MKRIGRIFRIYGRVQGVFYRKSAAEKAAELKLYGFVKNEPDGSVLLKASGSEESLRALENWCYSGSPMAVVNKIEVQDVTAGEEDNFTIRY